jgi:hypothetical protein
VWHPEHFCCAHCHAPFAGSEFFEKDGLPYCEEHYKQLFGRPCSKCDLVRVSSVPHSIIGGEIRKCTFAHALTRADHHHHHDHDRLVQPVTTNGVEALGKTWHREHFMCQNCDVLLDPMGRICSSEGYSRSLPHTPSPGWKVADPCETVIIFVVIRKPLCKKCYLRLPSKMRAQMEKQRMHEAKEAQRLKKEREKEIKRAEAEAKKTAKAAAKAKN